MKRLTAFTYGSRNQEFLSPVTLFLSVIPYRALCTLPQLPKTCKTSDDSKYPQDKRRVAGAAEAPQGKTDSTEFAQQINIRCAVLSQTLRYIQALLF